MSLKIVHQGGFITPEGCKGGSLRKAWPIKKKKLPIPILNILPSWRLGWSLFWTLMIYMGTEHMIHTFRSMYIFKIIKLNWLYFFAFCILDNLPYSLLFMRVALWNISFSSIATLWLNNLSMGLGHDQLILLLTYWSVWLFFEGMKWRKRETFDCWLRILDLYVWVDSGTTGKTVGHSVGNEICLAKEKEC